MIEAALFLFVAICTWDERRVQDEDHARAMELVMSQYHPGVAANTHDEIMQSLARALEKDARLSAK